VDGRIQMNVSDILGKEVLDKNANRVGKVIDIDINIAKGSVDYFVVKAGLTKKLYVNIGSVERAGDKVTLNLAKEELEKRPAPVK
jgi:sporulation protein YlmC with PRC-barrel domain